MLRPIQFDSATLLLPLGRGESRAEAGILDMRLQPGQPVKVILPARADGLGDQRRQAAGSPSAASGAGSRRWSG